MSRASRMLISLMVAAAMNGGVAPGLFREDPYEGEDEESRKRRYHKMNPVNTSEHEFIINGEKIMARNKKMARKIYENRHKGKKK